MLTNEEVEMLEIEPSAFENWLESTCPSGDAESVQRQWENSSDFANLYNLVMLQTKEKPC
jgi:hypothetical protein